MKEWWWDEAYAKQQPMVFPDKSNGPTKPVKIVGGCPNDVCSCKGLRIHGLCPCDSQVEYKCRCLDA